MALWTSVASFVGITGALAAAPTVTSATASKAILSRDDDVATSATTTASTSTAATPTSTTTSTAAVASTGTTSNTSVTVSRGS